MMIIKDCPLCKKDFMYDRMDYHLKVDLNGSLLKEYPISDEMWSSRRWNKEKTEYVDLSGKIFICQECYEKRSNSEDVNVDGNIVCSKKGCADDANGFSKYCNDHYRESYGQ